MLHKIPKNNCNDKYNNNKCFFQHMNNITIPLIFGKVSFILEDINKAANSAPEDNNVNGKLLLISYNI